MERIGSVIGGSGWSFVEHRMERQIEIGATTAEDFMRSLRGGFTLGVNRTLRFPKDEHDEHYIAPVWPSHMKSWQHFNDWKRQHPGQGPPSEVNRIRTDGEFAAWAAAGFPA